ncbi:MULTISPECIES: hypothetical protein [Desulfococcus]|jgi:hypothetical protein|uniref:Uncharacterized protein n=1 Tax=Desulfococcus multivorans DSM 2059 TaxID=1121405 RepID=S7VDH2_DESML|nr:hypothetical protein [Desulfococcus multivorans]AOY58228.1 uncharacterized protein Dmul_14530 [Desulfococcus multivorans]AQV00574.1 hypothetical protein B2D07_07195 [Desulfococcus multivorans]EPR42518.1 hypothetical protein dsmv_1644 [Desulfococcus multivorans DSM 2059]MDX9819540.1 hypothetical protein [Desulfococcus multivorans]SJZ96967.1 hypothetical protein SAMN02745446_02256 [Desulfococcus multivorans DSM 2059]
MTDEKQFQFKFFLPNARLLSDSEIKKLSANNITSAGADEKNGLWLEITCPDRSCLDADGRIVIPTQESKKKDKGFFLELFCPEDSCEIVESTDLP